jgi:protein dithiol oxidoreductase (disulfide-forming)
MLRPLVSILLLTLSVTACGRDTASDTPPPEQRPAASAAQTSPAPAPAQIAESQAATAAQESVSDTSPDESSDSSSLERLAAMPAAQQLPNGRWKLGTNYKPLMPPQPTNVSAGKVEVVEVFWYACPHCYVLEPFVTGWLKNKPEYVEFVRVPVMWSPGHKTHAHLFYTLEALGRQDLHQKVFDAIHQQKNTLLGNSEAESLKQMAAFAKSQGVAEKAFMDAWNSFGVASNLQRATQLTQRYRVEGVPLVVVNGKYTTDVSMAGGSSELIALINDLAASEKRR